MTRQGLIPAALSLPVGVSPHNGFKGTEGDRTEHVDALEIALIDTIRQIAAGAHIGALFAVSKGLKYHFNPTHHSR